MPLAMDNNTKAPVIQVKSSITIELIAAIQYLADRSHHKFPEKLGKTLLNNLSSDSQRMLKLLSGMRLQGLELFEFVIKERAFDDVVLLVQRIKKYDDISFIYTLLGEVLDHNQVREIMSDREKLLQLAEEKPVLFNDNTKGFEQLFYNTRQFKNGIVNLVKEMNNSTLRNKIDSLREDYSKQEEKVKAKLAEKAPMEVTHEIAQRKFKRVLDFKEFFFIPSYFISPHKIRVYCNEAQMIVFELEQRESTSDQIGDGVSQVFKIISDRTRLEILRSIIKEPTYGKLLAERMNLTTATISHHIDVLKSINLVSEKRIKNIKYFEANDEEIRKLFETGIEYLFGK